jgi:hypothetical protein
VKAERLGRASVAAFPARLDWSATADGLYLRFLLALYRHDGDRKWYDQAYANAVRARDHAASGGGLYLNDWNGSRVAPAGLLRTHAGTVALFAWMATVPAPPGNSAGRDDPLTKPAG